MKVLNEIQLQLVIVSNWGISILSIMKLFASVAFTPFNEIFLTLWVIWHEMSGRTALRVNKNRNASVMCLEMFFFFNFRVPNATPPPKSNRGGRIFDYMPKKFE